jgi:long-chain fatty acid transport protein
MKLHQLPRLTAVALGLAFAASGAQATNGYFAHGYGIKAKGMGGASVAMTHDAFAGANNPAAAAFAGNRWDLGVDVFSPKRSATRTMGGQQLAHAESDNNYFLVPEFGYNLAYSDKIGLNLTVYGNGGMNTEYPSAEAANFGFGSGKLGVDLMQLIVAPTIAYKLTDRAAVGVSPLLVYQKFKAYGIQNFAGFSSDSSNLTNRGSDSSTGFGVRLGYLNRVTDAVSFGASYSPKVDMGRFKKYAGLFAEGGDFDIPANYAVGLSFQATPSVQVALDYQRIEYSGVASVSNPQNNLRRFFQGDTSVRLAAANGAGFGWQDINVVKLGVQWEMSPTLTLRAGYNRGDNPIRGSDVTFNILAPGVMEQHFTLGGTMKLSKTEEVSGFFMHAKKNSVQGKSFFNNFDPNADMDETIEMSQNSLGLQYSKKF